mmetsp:Transcript_25267/g.39130  ORF Transcript_25267/g.39130 Transcript_25267/m.39130 type:complete len:85 (-) Transcript_25267:149-403(-)
MYHMHSCIIFGCNLKLHKRHQRHQQQHRQVLISVLFASNSNIVHLTHLNKKQDQITPFYVLCANFPHHLKGLHDKGVLVSPAYR